MGSFVLEVNIDSFTPLQTGIQPFHCKLIIAYSSLQYSACVQLKSLQWTFRSACELSFENFIQLHVFWPS